MVNKITEVYESINLKTINDWSFNLIDIQINWQSLKEDNPTKHDSFLIGSSDSQRNDRAKITWIKRMKGN